MRSVASDLQSFDVPKRLMQLGQGLLEALGLGLPGLPTVVAEMRGGHTLPALAGPIPMVAQAAARDAQLVCGGGLCHRVAA